MDTWGKAVILPSNFKFIVMMACHWFDCATREGHAYVRRTTPAREVIRLVVRLSARNAW